MAIYFVFGSTETDCSIVDVRIELILLSVVV